MHVFFLKRFKNLTCPNFIYLTILGKKMPDHWNLRDPVVISEFRISMATVLATVS